MSQAKKILLIIKHFSYHRMKITISVVMSNTIQLSVTKISALDPFLHVMDERPLKKALELAGFEILEIQYLLYALVNNHYFFFL